LKEEFDKPDLLLAKDTGIHTITEFISKKIENIFLLVPLIHSP
jgi:hypothetical protein